MSSSINSTTAAPPPPAPGAAAQATKPSRRRRCLAGLGIGLLLLTGWALLGGLGGVTNALAARALAHRDYDAGERWLEWSQRVSFDSGRTQFLLARLARHQNRFDDVRTHLLRAHELGYPIEDLEREQWLAQAQAGQMRDAEPHLPALLTSQRGDGAEICEAYVTGYLASYQLGRAAVVLQAWEQDFPDDPMPFLLRARIELNLDHWTGVEDACRKALRLAPEHPEALQNLGEALMAQQKYEEALGWFQKVPDGTVETLAARVGAARCLVTLDRGAAARTLLEKLTADHSQHPRPLVQLGQLELEAGNYERAVELLRKANALEPFQQETLYALASALRGANQAGEAARIASEVERIRDTKGKIARLVEKVGDEPEDAEARFEIGKMQLELGARREGVMWLTSVLQFQPDHAGAIAALEELAISPAQAGGGERPQ
ncbi:MAG: tetratricopeptide repeat protein [Planctomycetales bacterium]